MTRGLAAFGVSLPVRPSRLDRRQLRATRVTVGGFWVRPAEGSYGDARTASKGIDGDG